MNTDVHEYVSKSKRSCTVYLPVLAQRRRQFYSTATSRFFTYRDGVWNALTAISEKTPYLAFWLWAKSPQLVSSYLNGQGKNLLYCY